MLTCATYYGEGKVLLIIMVLVLLGMFTNSFSYHPFGFQCKNYVINSYLYLVLSLLIVGGVLVGLRFNFACGEGEAKASAAVTDSGDLFAVFRTRYMDNETALIMASCAVACAAAILLVPKTYFFTHHFFYLFFTVFLGIALYPLFDAYESRIRKLFYVCLAILVLFAIVTNLFPNLPYSQSGATLVTLIVSAATVSEGVEALLTWLHGESHAHPELERVVHVIATAGILLLAFFDSQRIVRNAATCVTANYIQESMHHVIDTLKMVFLL
jgi:hypothetical protein